MKGNLGSTNPPSQVYFGMIFSLQYMITIIFENTGTFLSSLLTKKNILYDHRS